MTKYNFTAGIEVTKGGGMKYTNDAFSGSSDSETITFRTGKERAVPIF
jgi:hypothetical protein